MSYKISIIMPVYNAASCIRRMLESIRNQTLSDFEVLMIDDGSTDDSGKILDEYSKMDQRFKVVHKQNGGVSAARQTGLELVQGEYVIHADSDDWVEPTMLEELYAKAQAEKADVVICDFYSNTETEQKYVVQRPSSSDGQQVMRDLFQQLHGSCCNKLVRRVCYNKCNAKFYPDIDYCEDLFFWYQVFSHPQVKVAYLPKAFYHYYCPVSHQSIMGSYSRKFLIMGFMLIEKMEQVLPPSEVKEEAIRKFKISQKCGAFEHPIYSAKEYYAIYPECNKYIFSIPTSTVNKILIWLSIHRGFYRIATWIYKLKNMIRRNKIR